MKEIDLVLNSIHKSINTSRNSTPNKGHHIFSDLTNRFKDEIHKDQFTEMFFYMNNIEKALKNYRIRDINTGNLSYNKITTCNYSFDNSVKDGMLSLFKAMESYRDYVYENYNDALENLDKAIELAINQSNIFPYFILAIGEQGLNRIRVLCKKNDLKNIEISYIELINFILNGSHKNQLAKKNILLIPEQERLDMVNYIINSIDFSLRKIYNKEEYSEFYNNISKSVINIVKSDSPIYKSFSIIQNFKTENNTNYIKYLNNNFQSFIESPYSIRKMIIEHFSYIYINNKRIVKKENNDRLNFILNEYKININ